MQREAERTRMENARARADTIAARNARNSKRRVPARAEPRKSRSFPRLRLSAR